ncbi:MAG: type VI secretion system-associated protein TagF [Candidatus Polarisedimenticolaceae bacterium]|nr:type VI secretion system-associated protein TagF [Candidatus Polarisedimenticolaceae bacterium]
MSSPVVSAPGFFGKLPSHGDFLSRRLPRSFIDPWDRWLQSAVANSREQLADEWLDIYLTSPLWRFALSPGLAGPSAWVGVLMPSVDRVGRYFPFTLAIPLDQPSNLLQLLSSNEAWFNQCEELLLDALNDNFNLDEFDQALQALPLPEQPQATPSCSSHSGSRPAWQFELPSMDCLNEGMGSLSYTLLSRLMPGHSIWSSHGSERIAPSLLINEGLPPIKAYTGLLDGDWQRWGWDQTRFKLPKQTPPPSEMGQMDRSEPAADSEK